MTEPIPVTLGRYVILEEIGRGMMGAVYRAADPDLGRTVALKTVRLAFAATEREREQFEQRFMAEARAAGGLSHPGIVVVHDVGRDSESGTLYIALEFLEGRTLDQLVADGPLAWREALRLTGRVADALNHAHARGIVHRDVKPANIMVLANGEPKIMDFGIAKLPTSQLTLAGQFFGTPAYMSPEQAIGDEIDGRSDIFSLGAIVFLLLTGQRAFAGSSVPATVTNVQSVDPPPPSTLVPGIPADVDYVVARALAKSSSNRYADGRSLAEDVEDVCEGREPRHRAGWVPRPAVAQGAAGDAGAERRGRSGWRWRSVWAGAVGLVVLGLLAGSVWWQRGTGSPARSASKRGSALPKRELAPVPDPVATPAARPQPTPVKVSTRRRQPAAQLEAGVQVGIEHALKRGWIQVWVDDVLVARARLDGRPKKRLLRFRGPAGRLTSTLGVEPGERIVRVRIDAGEDSWTESLAGYFETGTTRRVTASHGGLLRRRLVLEWTDQGQRP